MTDTYNQQAMDVAQQLMGARRARATDRSDVPLEHLLKKTDRAALGVALEWERMGSQSVSGQLQARADAIGATFEHLGLTLGTVVHDVDLRDPSDEVVGLVHSTLLERKVVFFRDQHLTEDEQVALGRRFGGLDAFPFGKPGDDPYILEIGHGPGSPGYENGWHTDVTWMEQPSLGSIAQLIEAPPSGGDTLFADSHAAYLGLPAGVREQVDGLSGVHDYRIFLAGRGEAGFDDDIVADVKAAIPFGVTHPLVRTHPETAKQALYLHGGFLRHDSLFDTTSGEPLGDEASRALVALLLQQHARPEYQCRFEWTVGSIAFWDNRAVQHYAASDYYPHRRVLRRVTVRGDRPFHRANA